MLVCELIILVKTCLARPNAPPPEPVSDIWGRTTLWRHRFRRFAAMSMCSAWWNIGPVARAAREGNPGGTSGGSGCSVSGRPRGTPCGYSPMRMLMASSSWPICLSRSGICALAASKHLLSLKPIQLRGDAVVHSERSELDGILLGLHGVARDLELQIKLQEREVVTRHVADKREHDRALRIFRGQNLGARRFSFSAAACRKDPAGTQHRR